MVKFEELDNITMKQLFMNYTIKLKDVESKEFVEFYNNERKDRYGISGILPVEYSHEYHNIKNEWQRRIAVIEMGDDKVIIILKWVAMFKHTYCKLEGLPISMGGVRDNEMIAVNKLAVNKLCKKFVLLEQEANQMDGLVLDSTIEKYNYHSSVSHNYDKMTNGWKTKRGVNRLLNNDKIKITKLTSPHNAVDSICVAFARWKKNIEKSTSLSLSLSKAISKYKYWDDKNVEYYLFEYDNFPVGMIVYVIVNDIIGYQIVNKGIDHMVFDDSRIIPDEIKKRIGALMHYYTIKDLHERGVTDVFAGPVLKHRKNTLNIYKSIMNDESFGIGVYKFT